MITDHLSEKLTAYLGLASSIFIVKQSDVQIIYTNPPDIVLDKFGSSAFIDLNNDGQADIEILVQNDSGYGKFIHVYAEYNSLRASRTCHPFSGFYTFFVTPLQAGEQVAAGNFTDWDNFFLLAMKNPSSCRNKWQGDKDRYIGLKFYSKDYSKSYFGWIRVSVTNNVRIKDWAYNSSPGGSILAGQMSGPEDKIPESNGLNDLTIENYNGEIKFENNTSEIPLSVFIYDELGRCVEKFRFQQSSYSVNLNPLGSGEYFCVVNDGRQTSTSKIMIH